MLNFVVSGIVNILSPTDAKKQQ